jgi:tRNA-dihydrouridine synthase
LLDKVSSSGAVSHFIIHARSAILSGLSPVNNRLVPPLRYDFVRQLASNFPSLRITLNGGVRSLNNNLKQYTEDSSNLNLSTDDIGEEGIFTYI